jgi:hypothetical protein
VCIYRHADITFDIYVYICVSIYSIYLYIYMPISLVTDHHGTVVLTYIFLYMWVFIYRYICIFLCICG